MFESRVLDFLPISASNGVCFVIPCGVMRKVLIASATSEASLNEVPFVPILLTSSRRLSVCINLSTTRMNLWLSFGAKRSLISFDLQKSWIFLAQNFFSGSHLSLRGTPLFDLYYCVKFNVMSTVVFETTLVVGSFDDLSITTSTYASLFSSFGSGPAKSNCDSSFGSTTGSIWNGCFSPLLVSTFYLPRYTVDFILPSARLIVHVRKPNVLAEIQHGRRSGVIVV